MNILAIDSSSQNLSVSLNWQGKVKFDFNRRIKFGASQLVYFIDKNFRKHGISLSGVDIFAIGKGPGSFTGLRVSFSVIKAFMLSLKKPAVAIGSFYAMAYPFTKHYQKIAVISDARRGLIYAAAFQVKNNALCKETKESLGTLKDFVMPRQEYFFVTYDEHLYKDLSAINPKIKCAKGLVYPKAKYYLEIARGFAEKNKFITLEHLEPLYLHPKTCQIRA